MANEINVPVKLQIENLQTIVNDMHKQLGTLKVDSTSYKKLSTVIADIEKRIQNLQVQSARPLINEKQFNGLNKEIGHIYDDLTKIGLAANGVKFNELSLDASQKQVLQEFETKIKSISDQLKNLKENAKNAFLESDVGKTWKEDNPKIATKSFEAITQAIKDEVEEQQKVYDKAKQAFEDYKNTLSASKKLNAFVKNGHELSEKTMGQELYNKVFNKNGNFKSGGKNLLTNWLTEQFHLDPDVVKKLVNDAGSRVKTAFAEASGDVEKALKQEQIRVGGTAKEAKESSNNGKTYTDQIANEKITLEAKKQTADAVTQANIALTASERELSNQLDNTKQSYQEYKDEITDSERAQMAMSNSANAIKGELASLTTQFSQGQARLAQLDNATSKLQGISNFVNRYIGAYAIIRKVTTAIRNAFENIRELDKVITNIAVVTNMSQEDLWNKVGQYTQVAQQYGVTTKDVYTVSQLFYQQGLQTSQVTALTTETLKMAKIAGMDFTEATNAMTVAIRAFNIDMANAQQVTDVYSALAAKFAVSSAEIANAMEKTASSASNVGMSIESTSAFISVMTQTTRESAQNIGSALKSIISRYGEMKASPSSLINVDGEEVAFNKVDTALKSIGISIKDASGQFRDFDDVIMELASKWNTLDNNTQRYIATVMAGNRQQSRFIALVSNYDELSRAMSTASNAENASIVQVAKTMDSIESKTNQLKNAFSQLYLDLGIESGLKSIYDLLTRIVTTIGKLGTFNGGIMSLMNIIGFGTGIKGAFKNIQERVQIKRDQEAIQQSELQEKIQNVKSKLELDTTEAHDRAKTLTDEIQQPVHKQVILDTTTTTTGMTDVVVQENKGQNVEQVNDINNASNTVITTVQANTEPAKQDLQNLKAEAESTPIKVKAELGADELSNQLHKSEFEKNIQDNLKTYSISNTVLSDPNNMKDLVLTFANVAQSAEQSKELFAQAGTDAIQTYIDSVILKGYELEGVAAGIGAKAAAAIKINNVFSDAFSNIDFSQDVNVDELVQNIQSKIEPLKSEFETVGSDIGYGLIAGLVGSQGGVDAQAGAIAQDILDRVKAVLEISSPSEKMREIGQYVVEGLTQGLQAGTSAVASAAENLGKKITSGVSKGIKGISNILKDPKNVRLIGSVARIAGTAVAGYGAQIQDKSTDVLESSKIVTGLGNGLSGMGTGISLGMMTNNPYIAIAAGVAGFLVSGIGAIFDGLHMSLEERLELEKKEAKEKSDAALKAQAKATDMNTSLDNIQQLRAAMYNSTEDMQAYKDAMNTLGQSYPELISTYDSMGNAVIDLQSAEEALMGVRYDAVKAAREAAVAEMKTRTTQAEIWDQAASEITDALQNPLKHGALLGNEEDIFNGVDASSDEIQQAFGAMLQRAKKDNRFMHYIENDNPELFNLINRYVEEGNDLTYEDLRLIAGTKMQRFANRSEDEFMSAYLFNNERDYLDFLERNPDLTQKQKNDTYYNTQDLESEITNLLQKNAESLNLASDITAREFFNWGEGETLTADQLGEAVNKLSLLIEGAKNNVNVLNSSVTRAYADEALNSALTASDITSARQIKFSTNSIFTTLIANGLEQAADAATNGQMSASEWAADSKTKEAFNKAKDTITQELMDEIVNWSDSDIEKFLTATGDMTQYLNADDLFAAAGIEKTSTIASELEAAFIKDNQVNRDRILKTIFTIDEEGEIDTSEINSIFSNLIDEGLNEELIHSLGAQFDGISDNQIISKYADYFTTELLAINELANDGYTKLAQTRLNVLSALADALGEIDSSKEQQDLFSTITSIDFTNYDQLVSAQKAIEEYRKQNNITSQEDGTWNVLQALINAQNNLVFNVHTLTESITENIINAAKEIDGILSTNKSGLDLSKALEQLDSLNVSRSMEDAFKFDNIFTFDAALGKYVYTVEGLKETIAATEGTLTDNIDKLKHTKQLYSQVQANIFDPGRLGSEASILYENLLTEFKNDKTIEHDQAAWYKFLQEKITQNNRDTEAAQQILDAYTANKPNQLFQNIDWSSLALGTDYTGSNRMLADELAKLLGLNVGEAWDTIVDTFLKQRYGDNQEAIDTAKVNINESIIQEKTSQYQNAISELLTYQTDKYLSYTTKTAASRLNINLDNLKDNAENAIVVAQEFLNQLAQQIGQAGYTLEQYNQDASSILERTLAGQTKGKALLDFASEDTIGASQLEGLANTLGLQLNELVNVATGEVTGILTDHLTFNTNTGSYEIQGSFESFIDALNKEYGNVIDKTSQQYIDALKSFNERKINQHNKIEKAMVDSIVGIDKAKTGDWIDLTEVGVQLSNKLLEWTELDESGTESVYRKTALYALNEELFKYGAELSEGILKLSDDANLLGIASTLQSITGEAGLELKDGLEEIADAVQNVLQSYTNAIKNGISGGLSHVDAADLSTKAADLGINKLDFIETAEGLKLSQTSAIELYTKLKQIDSLQGKLVFDELNKSLQESNEHYKSISDIANRIKEIESIPENTRSEQYKQELALAKEIYAVRSTTEDSSFNFMSNSIPAAQNNPINYYNNWAKAIHTFNDALKAPGTYTKEGKSYKSGFVDYDYWYNLVTEMNNIAKLGGDIKFAGETLDGSLEAASRLIQKGADSLVVTDAGEVKVALQGISVDFEAGADVFSGNVTEGIQAMAKSQVKMLDGMIQLLETVVAMEKLGDIEGAEDGTIDLTDLFPDFNVEGVESAVLKNTQMIDWINNTLLGAAEDSDIGQFIRNVELNGENLHTLLTDAATNGKALSKENAEALTTFINSLYQMYQSDNFNLNNIYASMQEVMGNANFSAVIPMGDSTLIIENGTTLLQTKEGKYKTPNGKEYDANQKDQALAETALELKGAKDITFDAKLGQATGTLTIGQTEFKMTGDKDGSVTYTANGITATSITDYIQQYIDKDMAHGGGQFHTAEQLQFELEVQYGITPLDSFTYKGLSDEIRTNLEKALASGKQTEVDAVIKANPVLSQLKGQTGEEISKLLGLDSIKTTVDNSQALDAINTVEEALSNLKDKTITITTIEKTVSDNTSSGGRTSDTSLSRPRAEKTLAAHAATGNIGLARSKGTLMGELGPELVVSNGRYFVAGQNGPEMINLADDAIVFNHLQTKSLLEKGMSSGRGKAVTNERNAVSFATGNVNGGPAMASASAALAALKQLRAQWQALAELSAQDLAGKGGGGGGGGGDPKAFVKELEKWYNWLQEIAQLEKEITLEESKRQKYQSSMIAMGREYAASQLDTLKKLKQQSAVQLSLNRAQSAYFEKRRKELNENSAFKALYYFDDNGQLKYKDGKLEQLSDLVGRDAVTGQANYTAKEQYEKLVEMGYAEQMMYDSSGNEIKQEGDDWYNTAIQAFWDKIEAEREEMQSLHDDVLDGENKLYELSAEQNQILHEIEDNQISVEQKVVKAIEDIRQQQIDDLRDEKDAIEKSSKSLIDGLSNQLQKEQDMRSKQQDRDELTTLQRRLAILQRSGGSASQIASLQKEISSKQEDAYFDAQQAQIDALQEATDNQLEKLQQQIDLMTEQLAYEKENGLLWQQVYEVMAKSPEAITSFIMENTKEYFGKSPTELTKETRDTLVEAQKFVEYREQVTGGLQELIDQNSDEAISELSDEITAEAETAKESTTSTETQTENTGSSSGNSNNNNNNNNKNTTPKSWSMNGKTYWTYGDANTEKQNWINTYTSALQHAPSSEQSTIKSYLEKWTNMPIIPTYAYGGIVPNDQFALVHAKEGILTAEQTSILRNEILSNKSTSLLSLLTDFRDAYTSAHGVSSYSSIGTSNGIIIENATVEMNVARIDNDYDAQRAGEQALDRMLQIARKTQGSNRIGR